MRGHRGRGGNRSKRNICFVACQSQVCHMSGPCRRFRRSLGNSFTSNARSPVIPSNRSFGRKVSINLPFRFVNKKGKKKNTLFLDTRVEFIFEIFPDSFDHGGGKLSGHVVSRWCKVAHKHETEGCERQPVHRYGATSRRSGHVHVHREEQA